MAYNASDFSAHADNEVKDDGTVVNASNGFDTDGIRFVKGKAVGPTLLATVPFSQFTVSNTLTKNFLQVLSRNAKARTFHIYNTMNVALSSLAFYPNDSVVQTVNAPGLSVSLAAPSPNVLVTDTSENKPLLASHVDS